MDSTATKAVDSTRTFGAYTLVAYTTVDGHYSISTFRGPNDLSELAFITPYRGVARLIYRIIAEGGRTGLRPEQILANLGRALVAALAESDPRVPAERELAVHLSELRERVAPISQEDINTLTPQSVREVA